MTGPTLVTGAAGFAGSHLVDQLLADGVDVVAWHRPGGDPPRALPGLRWQAVDMLDRAGVRTALGDIGPSVVFHCAGAAHVGQSWSHVTHTLQVNVLGTHHLVEGLRETGQATRVLNISSAHIYGSSLDPIGESHTIAPDSPYALSKLAQEMVGQGNGGCPEVYIARPFNHFGPRQDPSFVSAAFARQIAEIEAGLIPPKLLVGNLDALRDLTDVRDTVRAYRLIIERGVPERPYNICSGTAIAVHSLLDMLIDAAHVPVEVVQDPSRYRPNDSPILLGNPERATSELGWTPTIPVEQTANDLLEYWRARVRRA
ncbi:MAG: GDP-mannose 4,6-dehydratase [Vicinamibacterales bacterium]